MASSTRKASGLMRGGMVETIHDCVRVPEDAGVVLRRRLGLDDRETPRVAFVAGPGDVVGTFDHWMKGDFDPRVPVIAYSTMFYTLMDKLGAQALLLSEPEAQPSQEDPRFRFVRTPRGRPNGRIAYFSENFVFSLRVARELRAFRPHVVLLGTDAPNELLALAPRSARIVLTAHNTYWPMGRRDDSVKGRAKRLLIAASLRRVSSVVCTSAECCAQVGELRGTRDGSFVETPQMIERFQKPARKSETPRRLLFLGRLEHTKGIFDVLDAFEALAPKHPEITLDFAGSGSAKEELVGRIGSSPAKERVRFLGHLSGGEVHAALAGADLLICPTRSTFREGLALVVVEAAAHGVPSLLSSVVPAKELMPEACVEFPADDVVALRDRLEELLLDASKFDGLCKGASASRDILYDRSRSWGSMLYLSLVH